MIEDRSVLTRAARPPTQVLRYGLEPDQLADIRFGVNTPQQRPLIVMIHGGFWRPAYDRVHTGPMCIALADAGWTVASIEYRRIPGDPDATLDDVALAVQKLPSLITQHHGRVIVIGHSAGGHLALWAAARSGAQLLGVVALAPVADLQLAYQLQLDQDAVFAFLGTTPERRNDVDPAQLATPTMPVAIVHGEQDEVVPLSIAMSYHAKHPSTRLAKLPNTGHFALIDPLSTAWPTLVAQLRQVSEL